MLKRVPILGKHDGRFLHAREESPDRAQLALGTRRVLREPQQADEMDMLTGGILHARCAKQRLRLPRRLRAGTYTVKIAFKAIGASWAATGATKVSARR